MIALSSTISFVGVALASLIYYVCKTQLGFSLLQIFMVCGAMTLAAGIYLRQLRALAAGAPDLAEQ